MTNDRLGWQTSGRDETIGNGDNEWQEKAQMTTDVVWAKGEFFYLLF